MKFTCVEVLKKEECLAIAKIIHGDGFTNDELLEYLPDYVFGETFNVDYICEYFNCCDFDGKTTWQVPPYFVKKVMNKFI